MDNERTREHYRYQLKRSKAYKRLLGVSIPDRGADKKVIVDVLWYIIWEKNILKPKIFRYSFVSDIFAINFANKHLQGKPYYIIKGVDLKKFGILKVNIGLKYAGVVAKAIPHKYDFPEGLTQQRRKTLRTMYRRNLRRLLLKLLKKKNKKMSDLYVLKKIEEKPGAFFKKFKKQWYYELIFSVTFKQWYLEEEGWMVDDVMKAAKQFPRPASEIANIVTVLREHYSDVDYNYKNDTYTSLAIKLWKSYRERIIKYLRKKGYNPKLATHNKQEAYLELIARGFLPPALLEVELHPDKDLFLCCKSAGMIVYYPYKINSQTQNANELQLQFGVTGYTGINYPKDMR